MTSGMTILGISQIECHSAERRFFVMPSVIMLSAFTANFIMLGVVMVNVIMLSVVMLSVIFYLLLRWVPLS
jgi:hypothetical protein